MMYQHLSPIGAKVTESNLVHDSVTQALREADITVEMEIAGHQVLMAIECRDRRRPADIEWIDQLIGKYVNRAAKVVAVSSSGFTAAAKEKAAGVGIDTMTIHEAADTDWCAWVNSLDTLWVTLVDWGTGGLGNIEFVDKSIDSSLLPVMNVRSALTNLRFRLPDQSDAYTALELLNQHFATCDPLRTHAALIPRSDGLSVLAVKVPTSTMLLLPDGRTHGVETLHYLLRPRQETFNVPLKPGEYGVAPVGTGSGANAFITVHVVVVQDQTGRPQMSVRIQPRDPVDVERHFRFVGIMAPMPPAPPLRRQ